MADPYVPFGNLGMDTQTALNLGFLTGNPKIAREIQILMQVFRTETQTLIVISSPVFWRDTAHIPLAILTCQSTQKLQRKKTCHDDDDDNACRYLFNGT